VSRKTFVERPVGTEIGNGCYEGIIRAAMEISKRQTADLRRIQEALNAGDDCTALLLMRQFFVIHEGDDNDARLRP
jgi:hypothetical protein